MSFDFKRQKLLVGTFRWWCKNRKITNYDICFLSLVLVMLCLTIRKIFRAILPNNSVQTVGPIILLFFSVVLQGKRYLLPTLYCTICASKNTEEGFDQKYTFLMTEWTVLHLSILFCSMMQFWGLQMCVAVLKKKSKTLYSGIKNGYFIVLYVKCTYILHIYNYFWRRSMKSSKR
jgi:hypothetical protein